MRPCNVLAKKVVKHFIVRCFVIFGSFTVKRIETNYSLDHGWSGTSVKKVDQMMNTLQGQHHAQLFRS